MEPPASLIRNLQPVKVKIKLPKKKLLQFLKRWRVSEFALFGSVLQQDFGPDSDIDVLVSFSPNGHWSLFDLVTMQSELEEIFGREVDLVEKDALRNPYRRRAILENMQVLYADPKS